ncbi:MAG: NUDIX hydrolase [Caulobacteraceae bacterium]|nr:NUDIX hydrolase [Caulobacter sp.]
MVDDHGDAVAVLPYDPARRTAVLTRQERAPPLVAGDPQPFLEALAGLIDEGEAADAAARREADEETGLELDALEFVGRLWSSPGVCTERMSLYLAAYDEDARQGEGGGLASEHEEIEVVELPLAELAAMADAGAIVDMKTLALVQTLRLRRPELFAG